MDDERLKQILDHIACLKLPPGANVFLEYTVIEQQVVTNEGQGVTVQNPNGKREVLG